MNEPQNVADRLLREGLLPLEQALEEAGVHVELDKARRWVTGVGGVRLEAIALDARMHTSVEAVRRFVRARFEFDERRRQERAHRRRAQRTNSGRRDSA